MRSFHAFCAALLAALALTSTAEAGAPAELLRRELEAGNAGKAAPALKAMSATSDANGDEARMAQGMAEFVIAIENFGQGLQRHGFITPGNPFLPLLRLPVPMNKAPEAVDYQKMRAIYQGLLDDLKQAATTLEGVTDERVKITLDLNAVRLRLAANPNTVMPRYVPATQPPPAERSAEDVAAPRLADIIRDMAPVRARPPQPQPSMPGETSFAESPETWMVSFDRSDAYWLAGYSHLLSAISEFVMAHDWSTTFDSTAGMFFPGAAKSSQPPGIDPRDLMGVTRLGETGGIIDQVALLHLVHWTPGDKARMGAARNHLKAAIALSRRTWASIRAETDDDNEWLPSPAQQSRAVPGMPITEEMVSGWLATLDDFEAVLDGRKLLAHWRFTKGVDLRMVFEDPKPFDLVLWVTGHGAAPFLKDGPVIGSDSLQLWNRVFRNNFMGYAIFIN